MKVLFRVDASSAIGMGHLMRCLALAQAFDKSSIQTIFAVSNNTLGLCKSRHDWVGELLVVPNNIDALNEAFWLEKIVRENEIDALVLDGYQFSQPYRQRLVSLPCAKILFDDNNDSGSLYSDLVINGAENAAQLGYQLTAPEATYCLGSQYRILRQEFVKAKLNKWDSRHLLTICMGGSDPKNITLPLLEALQVQDVQAPICVISGGAYQHLAKLKAFVAGSHMSLEHIHDCQNMADNFCQSRLVVSAAGGSQFELLACQTPSLLVVVADNQLNATQQASKQGWCTMLDARNAVDFNFFSQQINELWDDQEKLKLMSVTAKSFRDIDGASRVVAAIISLVKTKKQISIGH